MKDIRQQQIEAETSFMLDPVIFNSDVLVPGQVRENKDGSKRYIVLEQYGETLITRVLNVRTLEYDHVCSEYLAEECIAIDTWGDDAR